jgi:hypothetical protein
LGFISGFAIQGSYDRGDSYRVTRLSNSALSAPAMILRDLFRHLSSVATAYSAFVFIGGPQQGMKSRVDLQHTPPAKALRCRLLSLTSAVRPADGLESDLRPRMRYRAAKKPSFLDRHLTLWIFLSMAVAVSEREPGFQVATGLRARRAIGA